MRGDTNPNLGVNRPEAGGTLFIFDPADVLVADLGNSAGA